MPGYGADVEKNRAEARKIMEGLGYGPSNPLKVKVATRNIPLYRDPAVILIDQLKKVHVEAELDVIDTSVWFAKVARGDYSVGLNLTAGRRSTTRTSTSTRTTPAARSATTPSIAIPRSRS